MKIINLLKIILFSLTLTSAVAKSEIQFSRSNLNCENGTSETQMVFKESFREYATLPSNRFFLLIRSCQIRLSEESGSGSKKSIFKLTHGYYMFGVEDAKYGTDFNVYPIGDTENNSFEGVMEINEVRSHGNFVHIQNLANTISAQGNFYSNSQVYFNINGKSYPASVINYTPSAR